MKYVSWKPLPAWAVAGSAIADSIWASNASVKNWRLKGSVFAEKKVKKQNIVILLITKLNTT